MPLPHHPQDLLAMYKRWVVLLPRLLAAVCGGLIVMGVLRSYYLNYATFTLPHSTQILERFHFGNEMTFVAWFSTCLLLFCGILSSVIAGLSSTHGKLDTWRWWLISGLFIAMSADENLALHEMLGGPLDRAFQFEGFLYYSWVVVAIPGLIIMALILGPMLLRLPKSLAPRLSFAAVIYFGGAVGVEMISGKIVELFEEGTWVRDVCGYLEETMEMTGLILAISALLRYILWSLTQSERLISSEETQVAPSSGPPS